METSSVPTNNSTSHCLICLEDFTSRPGHDAVSLNCHHVFGRSCIIRWGSNNPTCPGCRAPFDPDQIYDRYITITRRLIRTVAAVASYFRTTFLDSHFALGSMVFTTGGGLIPTFARLLPHQPNAAYIIAGYSIGGIAVSSAACVALASSYTALFPASSRSLAIAMSKGAALGIGVSGLAGFFVGAIVRSENSSLLASAIDSGIHGMAGGLMVGATIGTVALVTKYLCP
ncbi:RING finger domain-containing protein [Endozoicomonas sp. YOMI1]|uniref:RING finger domain-containing protein n=1 Tax=Endozoicomonas sp. YOMI1 TaxID=2828739 RepID=UPI0021489B5C|nr:RING finger domain-containing protein [Endozoicomonas sp. YOMI1]